MLSPVIPFHTNTLYVCGDEREVVHQAGGAGVLALRETMYGLVATSTMHTKVHQADGSGVLALRETVDVLYSRNELHAELYGATGADVLVLLDLEGHVRVQSEDGGQGRGEHVRGERGDPLPAAGERGTATGDPAPEDGGVD